MSVVQAPVPAAAVLIESSEWRKGRPADLTARAMVEEAAIVLAVQPLQQL